MTKSAYAASTAAKKASQNGNASKASASGKKQKTLKDLLEEGLKDVYSAEKQLVEALPEFAKACSSEDLEDAFTKHLQQTKRQAERIEKIFQRLGINKAEEKKCEAMEGLIKEGQKIIEEFDESPVRDSALIIGAQKIEHYEIAAYGSLCELADVLGLSKVAEILDRTLEEEENTDQELTQLAEEINDEAYELSEQQEGEEEEEQEEV